MRTILITGASGGIAQALVKLLPNDRLILTGRNAGQLRELYTYHAHAEYHELDITDSQAIASLVDDVYRRHGRLDILINNAGYGVYDDFDRFSRETVRQIFEVNTFAAMDFCQQIGGRMKRAGEGKIINIVSMSGYIATAKSSLYSASKFALIGYSDAIRLELADCGVQVTSINPGPVETKFFDHIDPDGSYRKSVQSFIIQPESVAKKILTAVNGKKRHINLPWTLNLAHKCYSLFPSLSDFLARKFFNYK